MYPMFTVDAETRAIAVPAFAFYCLALAVMGARPWGCHPSRLRQRGMVPLPPPLPPLAPSAAQPAADDSSDVYVPEALDCWEAGDPGSPDDDWDFAG